MSNVIGAPDQARVDLLYSFCRMQLPAVSLPPDVCEGHLQRTFQLYQSKSKDESITWDFYLDNLYPLDWFITAACLEGNEPAWDYLFAARAYRSDCLLMDALRSRAAWLYPRNEERQESSVLEFWSNLFIPPDTPQGLPVLKRYDGLRPLIPWLIRVFQNHHLSKLRNKKGEQALPEDDIIPIPAPQPDRWRDVFCEAAREWLQSIGDKELLILGLRLRYNLSQRDVAGILEIHEGTISRRTDALSEQWKETVSKKMIERGWTGDNLSDYVRTEMRNLLLDDPRLSIDNLAQILAAQGKTLPTLKE
ncbi:MAG: sigma-70 family RNA polymerase sigma factor [Gemmataceae bacterium]